MCYKMPKKCFVLFEWTQIPKSHGKAETDDLQILQKKNSFHPSACASAVWCRIQKCILRFFAFIRENAATLFLFNFS
jgi:hypothetical protein